MNVPTPTPDQMRALADRTPTPVQEFEYISAIQVVLNAAADEVERLRLSDWNATTQRDQLADALRRSDNENDRLRAVLENAPHDAQCRTRWSIPRSDCTCWKADAL